MGRLSPSEKKLNLIFFIGSGKPKTFRFPFIVIEIIGTLLLIGVVTIIALFYFNTQHRGNIKKLEDQIETLKKGIFYIQVTINNILSQKYDQRKQYGFEASEVSQTDQDVPSKSVQVASIYKEKESSIKNTDKKKITEHNVTPSSMTQVKPIAVKHILVKKADPKISKLTSNQGLVSSSEIDKQKKKVSISQIRFKHEGEDHFLVFRLNTNISQFNEAYKGLLIVKARFVNPNNKEVTAVSSYPKAIQFNDEQILNIKDGYRFRIRKFKDFNIALSKLGAEEYYTDVTFYVFSREGDLIYKNHHVASY